MGLNLPLTKVEGALLLDVIVGQGAAVLELFASEDEALLIGRDSLLVLDLGLDIVDGVRGLDLKGDGLSGEGLNEDLHAGGKGGKVSGGDGGRRGGGMRSLEVVEECG